MAQCRLCRKDISRSSSSSRCQSCRRLKSASKSPTDSQSSVAPSNSLTELDDRLQSLLTTSKISYTTPWTNAYEVPGGNTSMMWETFETYICNCCNMDFGSPERLYEHDQSLASGCDAHQECFSWKDNLGHAKKEAHNQCFVRGCKSKYGIDVGWTNEEIKDHVKKAHRK